MGCSGSMAMGLVSEIQEVGVSNSGSMRVFFQWAKAEFILIWLVGLRLKGAILVQSTYTKFSQD